MYHIGEQKRESNPKDKSNIFTKIFFLFTFDLLKKGYKRDIEENDIYEVLKSFKSSTLGDELEKYWTIEKTQEGPSLYRLMWNCYGRVYLLWGFAQLFMKTSVIFIQPYALGKLVKYFTNQTEITQGDAIWYATVLISMNIINCTYAHNYMFFVTELGIRVRTAFCSLIYRKVLRLSATSLSEISIGNIVTLISKDVYSIDTAVIFLNDMWVGAIHIIITTYLLHRKLGPSAFTGIGFLLLMIPFQVYVGKLTSQLRLKTSKVTDQRLQLTQETLSAIKVIKMYTWEENFQEEIARARTEEISQIKNLYYAKAASLVIGGLLLNITLYIIIMTYTGLEYDLTAEVTVYLISCLHSLRTTVTTSIPLGIAQTAELVASMKRINKILTSEEEEEREERNPSKPVEKPYISLENVEVEINKAVILHNINLTVTEGLYCLTGIVGAGKSSLMKTILKHYPITNGKLITRGSISYASEEPWLFPSTIRQNILFGQTYDQHRYKKILELCALNMDLETFDNGDETFVEDRAMNLSKGQQARICLARAIYKNSDIYLLDDCLSSLDVHVENYVFTKCIRTFLKDKIVIMISHNEKHVKEADFVVIMENGTIKSCMKPRQIPKDEMEEIFKGDARNEIPADVIDNIQIEDAEVPTESTKLIKNNVNIYHEDQKQGKVNIEVYKKYCSYGGGIIALGVLVALFVITQVGSSVNDKVLQSGWVNIQQNISEYKMQKKTITPEYETLLNLNTFYTRTYTILTLLVTFLTIGRIYAHFRFTTKSSINLHQSMIRSIANANLIFFDQQYIGTVLNRFSRDLGNIDEWLPFVIYELIRGVCFLCGIMINIAIVRWISLVPAAVLLVFLYLLRKMYIPIGRSLKRLDAATRSPVIGHLNASFEGLVTLRAYNNQMNARHEFDKQLDLFTSTFHMSQSVERIFAYTLDLLCNFFISSIVVTFLVINKNTLQAGDVGLAITQAFMLTGTLQWIIRQSAQLENQMTSVERVLEYTKVNQENLTGLVTPDWPSEGKITYENVNLRYGFSKDYVLKNVNFTINGGFKVGVVGRTGAGKSSIIATLFRLYRSAGTIRIDDVDIVSLNIRYLRSHISIIPQNPILFAGTVRRNIDPVSKYSDEDIWNAIKTVKLNTLLSSLDEVINDSGRNFSAGQKQLICLARAIVCHNKIIILDEATSNMDQESADVIHDTIRESFHNCTVVTIAHRLRSVMNSDRVMVVDKGEVVEFDQPEILLKNKDGFFYKMAEHAHLL